MVRVGFAEVISEGVYGLSAHASLEFRGDPVETVHRGGLNNDGGVLGCLAGCVTGWRELLNPSATLGHPLLMAP
jgi:hypothetical protein